MSDSQAAERRGPWRTSSELPQEVFAVLRKPERAINPVAIVATVDEDGSPHTAPFGSVRAATPRLLRLTSWRGHGTYANLIRDGRVSVSVVAPPDVAVSVRGRARVAREQMVADEQYAMVEIDVEEVKNDMVRSVLIETALTVSPREQHVAWFEAVLGELEAMP
jgi:flavin reductase (DIM6/NTAB) family NADH-FMN oxidoreductase RutF